MHLTTSIQHKCPIPFEPDEFAIEQFLHGMQSDVQSLTWCIKKALRQHAGIDCNVAPFVFGDYDVECVDRWAWSIVDLHAGHRTSSFVVSATERFGFRSYTVETDEGILENIPIQGNEARLFDFLAQYVFREYLSIAQGRSAGMPAFGAMLPDRTIWELVAYIQNLSDSPDHSFGTTTSTTPEPSPIEQVPVGQIQSPTPWKYTEPMPPNGEKNGAGSEPPDAPLPPGAEPSPQPQQVVTH